MQEKNRFTKNSDNNNNNNNIKLADLNQAKLH